MLCMICLWNCQGCSKTCVKHHSQKDQKLVFKTNYRLMQVRSIAECSKGIQGEHSTILSTFIKLPLSLRSLFCLFLSGRFTQVLLYFIGAQNGVWSGFKIQWQTYTSDIFLNCESGKCWVKVNLFLKWVTGPDTQKTEHKMVNIFFCYITGENPVSWLAQLVFINHYVYQKTDLNWPTGRYRMKSR